MIRTLAFIHHKYPYGGGERVTSQIASFLSNNGFKVYVFVRQLERENVMTSDNESIEFLPLPDVENINAPINRDFVISSIKERSIDLFIDPSIDVSYLKDIKELGVCKVIYVLHSRPLWEVILKDLVGRANSKRSIIKFIEWWLLRYPKHKLFRTTEKRFSKRYKKLYDLVDFYGVLCNADANSVANIVGVELETSKIGVLTNPAYKELEPNRSKRKQLIYVGRIENINKRVDRLIDIWGSLYKEFSDWELIIVGDGPGLAHLEEMVNSRGLER
ncbi:MAG: glycosyltransferase, partial [Bacteroidales bacterium]